PAVEHVAPLVPPPAGCVPQRGVSELGLGHPGSGARRVGLLDQTPSGRPVAFTGAGHPLANTSFEGLLARHGASPGSPRTSPQRAPADDAGGHRASACPRPSARGALCLPGPVVRAPVRRSGEAARRTST